MKLTTFGKRSNARWILLTPVSLLFCSISILAQNSPPSGIPSPESRKILLSPHKRVVFEATPFLQEDYVPSPAWDKGYLISRHAVVSTSSTWAARLYDANGNMAREVIIWFPGTARLLVNSAAATADGRIVAAGTAEKADGTAASFLAETDVAGNVTRVIQTNPYVPGHVCVTPSGAVWTFGWSGRSNPDALALRRFDFQKGELAAYLPVSSFKASQDPNPAVRLGRGRSVSMTCSFDRVAIYTETGGEYIEVDYATETVRRWQIDSSATGLTVLPSLVVSPSGDVYARLFHGPIEKQDLRGLFQLERDSTAGKVRWMPVEGQVSTARNPAMMSWLLGIDGDALVYTTADDRNAVKWARLSNRQR